MTNEKTCKTCSQTLAIKYFEGNSDNCRNCRNLANGGKKTRSTKTKKTAKKPRANPAARVKNGTKRLRDSKRMAKRMGMTFRPTDRLIRNYRAYELVDRETKELIGEYNIASGYKALDEMSREARKS